MDDIYRRTRSDKKDFSLGRDNSIMRLITKELR